MIMKFIRLSRQKKLKTIYKLNAIRFGFGFGILFIVIF